MILYVCYGYHRSVEGRQRAAYASQHAYEVVAADGVSDQLRKSLYGTITTQQPKRKDDSSETILTN